MAPARQRVLIYPFDENPYQRLLVDACHAKDGGRYLLWKRLHCSPLIDFAIAMVVGRLMRLKTLHLHWPEIVSAPAWLPGSRRATRGARRALLALARRLGYDLVWTVHNLVPHAPRTDDDRAEAAHLLGRCSLVFVHSDEVAAEVASDVTAGTPVVTIPHGNYVDEYRCTVDAVGARQALGLAEDDFTFLFFGKVRAYKGVPDLVAAWGGLPGRSRLVIAGECTDPSLVSELDEAARLQGVTVRRGFVPPDEAAVHLTAADVVCFPFRAVTTSGSLLLALSLGRPVVVPDVATLPADIRALAFTYEPGSVHGLRDALAAARAAAPDELRRRGDAGLAYAHASSWDVVADLTLHGYRSMAAP